MANFFDQFDAPANGGNFFDQFASAARQFDAGQFDTKLTPEEEAQFQAWKQQNAPNDSGADYDLRGAFKAGLTPDPQTGHWADTFKKPNHETFSNESQYGKVPYAAASQAGSWQGDTYLTPQQTQRAAFPGKPQKFVGLTGETTNLPVYDPSTAPAPRTGGGIGEILDFAVNLPRGLVGGRLGLPGDVVQLGATGVDMARNAMGGSSDLASGVPFTSKKIQEMLGASESDSQAAKDAQLIGNILGGWGSLWGDYKKVKDALPAFTKKQGAERAAEITRKKLVEKGFNPADVSSRITSEAKDLAATISPSGTATAGVTSDALSGNPVLADMRAALEKESPSFAYKAEKQNEGALNQLGVVARNVASEGNPAALKQAAQERLTGLTGKLKERMAQATTEIEQARQMAETAAQRDLQAATAGAESSVQAATTGAEKARQAVVGGGKEAQTRASAMMRRAIETAQEDARKLEKPLWDAIPWDVPKDAAPLLQAEDAARAANMLLPTAELSGETGKFLRFLRKKPGSEKVEIEYDDGRKVVLGDKDFTLTSGHVKALRSAAAEDAEKAFKAGDRTLGSVYESIREAASNQLAGLPGFDEANAFTRAKHEAFDTPAMKAALSATRPEELAAGATFGTGGPAGAFRFEDLQKAASFPEGSEAGAAMQQAQKQFIESTAGLKATDAAGVVKPNAVDEFLRQNPALEKQYPELAANLRNAAGAERNLTATEAAAKSTISEAEKTASAQIAAAEKGAKTQLAAQEKVFNTRAKVGQKALSEVIGVEDTVEAVRRTLKSDTPRKDFSSLVRTARKAKDPQQALDGTRAAVLQSAMQDATIGEALSFVSLEAELKKSLPLMKSSGILDDAMENRIKNLVARGKQIEKKSGDARAVTNLLEGGDAFAQFVLRALGRIGGKMAGGSALGPFGAATAGSEVATEVFRNLPLRQTQDALAELFLDPKLMADALAKPGKTKNIPADRLKRLARIGIVMSDTLGGDDGG